MLIALVNMGMSITDAAMVSVLFGADALAAVAVGSDLYSILFYFGAGTLGGLAPFYAAAVVRAEPARAGAAGTHRAGCRRAAGGAARPRALDGARLARCFSGSILPCSITAADTPASWR